MKRNINEKSHFILATIGLSVGLFCGVSVSAQTAAKTQPVRVINTESEAVPVKIVPGPVSRKPFQIRMFVGPKGTGNDVSHFIIPAGKRVVIENVSAISRIPVGLKAEVSFFTTIDSNDDGVGDSQDITFHRIPLVDQGNFDGVAISMANFRTLVFGDGTIGASQFSIGLQGRLNAVTTEFTQIQVTFSGYLEDLPGM